VRDTSAGQAAPSARRRVGEIRVEQAGRLPARVRRDRWGQLCGRDRTHRGRPDDRPRIQRARRLQPRASSWCTSPLGVEREGWARVLVGRLRRESWEVQRRAVEHSAQAPHSGDMPRDHAFGLGGRITSSVTGLPLSPPSQNPLALGVGGEPGLQLDSRNKEAPPRHGPRRGCAFISAN
jgi:hypothetical protein